MDPGKDNSNKTDVNTGGGAFTSGNVDAGGNFTGRDHNIYGDVVKNKIVIQDTVSSAPSTQTSPRWRHAITINTILIGIFSFLGAIATNIATGILPESWKPYLWVAWPLAVLITGISIWLTLRQSKLEDADSPIPTTVAQRNRQGMLKQVRLDWIDGVLNRSLYREVLISLGLEERPEAIVRPFDAQVQRPNQKPQSLPTGTKIIDVFEQFGGSLLILGAPGAGKTTMLLELARDLLDRAEQDEKQLIPVVFNLSSWAVERQPLTEWLVEELNTKYHIPRKVAQSWVSSEQILPLLDGLDEVAADYRTSCVEVINNFYRTHRGVGMIVCSRIADYETLQAKLLLQSAVLVQPLTRQQVDEYLKGLGRPLAGVRAALQDDPTLQELIETPLWSSVITLAYEGLSPQKLRAATTPEERRSEILTTYILTMFKRRSKGIKYTQQQTLKWISWLARQMVQRSQTVFLIERLQPDWLDNGRELFLYRLGVKLVFGLGIGLLAGLFGGLVFGLGIGLLAGLTGVDDNKIEPAEILNFSWKNGLVDGLFGGLVFGLIFGLRGGLFGGLVFGLIFGLIAGLTGGFYNLSSMQEFKASWRENLVFGLGISLLGWLLVGLIFGLSVGLLGGLSVGLLGKGRSTEVEIKRLPNQGIRQSLKNGLLGGLGFGLLGGLGFGLLGGLGFGLFGGLGFELLGGLGFGLFGGLGFGLFATVIFGLDACIKHFLLRCWLYHKRRIPCNHARFLDYCHDRIFLRKVGGGYIFIHRMVMEHFASLTDEDIARIASDVDR